MLVFSKLKVETSLVPHFRYAQHCPLARGAEIIGQRWTLLIVRELVLGSKRFSASNTPVGTHPRVGPRAATKLKTDRRRPER